MFQTACPNLNFWSLILTPDPNFTTHILPYLRRATPHLTLFRLQHLQASPPSFRAHISGTSMCLWLCFKTPSCIWLCLITFRHHSGLSQQCLLPERLCLLANWSTSSVSLMHSAHSQYKSKRDHIDIQGRQYWNLSWVFWFYQDKSNILKWPVPADLYSHHFSKSFLIFSLFYIHPNHAVILVVPKAHKGSCFARVFALRFSLLQMLSLTCPDRPWITSFLSLLKGHLSKKSTTVMPFKRAWSGSPTAGCLSEENFNSKRYMHYSSLKKLLFTALFTIAKTWKLLKCPLRMNGHRRCCVCTHSGVSLSLKKSGTMPFATTWMDLEVIILREVSQTEKDKCHVILLICRISKRIQRNLLAKYKLTHRYTTQTYGD